MHHNSGARKVAQSATKRGSPVSNSLLAVLKDEIKYERESYRRDEELEGGPPNDFLVQDDSGTCAILLGKEFGDEEILVRVSLDMQPDFESEEDEDEDEDEGESTPVTFDVRVIKDGTSEALSFQCESDGEYLTITGVAMEAVDGDDEDGPPPYRGPVFEDLDDTLQQAFVDFLEERGINAYLGEYIRKYLDDKAAREYQQWLGRVKDFIGR